MKRFGIYLIAVSVVLVMVCAAGAADFTGKWISYKMAAEEGGESIEVNFEEELGESFSEEMAAFVEFKDGKASMRMMMGDEDLKEFSYKTDGDKLVVEITDEMKAEGLLSMEFSLEGANLVFAVKMEGGAMSQYYRRPK